MRNVVIIGGGFGGLTAARALKRAGVHVTLIDRRNHHLFQPLLYQVATAGLSPADIAAPIRGVLRDQANAEVILDEVVGVDRAARVVRTREREFKYDDLVIATGSTHSYFGHDEWEKFAPGLKTIPDATRIRREILLAFERAEMESDASKRQAHLTFVLVGAGPTGVELAGSIAELAYRALRSDFRHIDPSVTKIILVEAGPRILASFPADLAASAAAYLVERGVEIRVGGRVEHLDAEGVVISGERVLAKTVIWAAGVIASPAAKWLGAEADRAGRVKVDARLTVPGFPEIFVIGDTAFAEQNGKPLPGLAPVAMQQGRYVAKVIAQRARARGRITGHTDVYAFHYRDKGNLATVGRSFAVADMGRFHLHGLIAWLAWLAVHIYYLIGYRNRVIVLLEWAWAYVTFQRGARLITTDDGSCLADHEAAGSPAKAVRGS